ncbi:MAG TPA: ornithine aminomutase subunit alpha [Sedimentibacter sp.]|mgnify:FL=1|nr:ornithine aminomutase subunit alpha [Sedimentibacter sp.]HNZ82678.1 ornithine aminomutase subunit alpha [Sedimentibacter sp.]HOH69746.1 ornithine aminomutase subunit alpha [Sedimentibacter sp.]HPW99276.1 ornithine aminomutase subunit alpha [Sedimentibacter sp.]
MKRADDYQQRRAHLEGLSDEELYERFWKLANEIVDPLLELGRKNTTPSVERSILLRMGFSSIEVKPIVEGVMNKGLMGKGAGNVVWRLSKKLGCSVREAGLLLADGKHWDDVDTLF